MKQISLAAAGDSELKSRTTRKRVFFAEMQQVVPWSELEAIIAPYAKQSGPKGGRPPFVVSVMQNSGGQRDPGMHQTKKGNQWYFGMKAHIGVDADSGLVHTLTGTAANVHDVTQAHALLHGEETDVFADSGYRGAHKRDAVREHHPNTRWHVAMMPGKRRALDKTRKYGRLLDEIERTKARIRAKVEHPFRVLKRQFDFTKVRYRGLAKNMAQLQMLFTLGNLWMVRKRILQTT